MNYQNNHFSCNQKKPWSPLPMKSNPKTKEAKQKEFTRKIQVELDRLYSSNTCKAIMGNAPTAYTANGALAYSTTGKALLDIHYQLSSLREKSEDEILNMWRKAYTENPYLAIRWLFFIADIREGAGERRTFQIIIKDIASHGGDWMMANLVPLIPEYTRWDMIYTLLEVRSGLLYDAIKKLVCGQWKEDMANMKAGRPISLMAKWLKSANSHTLETREWGLRTANMLQLTEKQYRQGLSALRNYLQVVETRMSSNNWQAIDYEKVPSKANLIYSNAFMRNDTERRKLYLDALHNGDAKINSKVLFPYEIVSKYPVYSYNDTLEMMWKNLPNMIPNGTNTMVVCDTSGSMTSKLPESTATALDVAYSLAFYFAERNKGAFHNKVMTFSNTPKWIDLSNLHSLRDKIKYMRKYTEIANTNIQAVFNLILFTAFSHQCSQDEMPDNILILTDGEWDSMVHMSFAYNETLFQNIQQQYLQAGYKMPKLIFWNIRNHTNTTPYNENEKFPCILVSGFSLNTFKMVVSNQLDPWKALCDEIMGKRYDIVENLAFSSNPLASKRTYSSQSQLAGTHVKDKVTPPTKVRVKRQNKKRR